MKTILTKLKPQLRALLTAIGAVIFSFNIGTENEIALWVALAFPLISAIWAIAEGHLLSVGGWIKRVVQSLTPLLVFYKVLTPESTAAITVVAFIVISLLPSETNE